MFYFLLLFLLSFLEWCRVLFYPLTWPFLEFCMIFVSGKSPSSWSTLSELSVSYPCLFSSIRSKVKLLYLLLFLLMRYLISLEVSLLYYNKSISFLSFENLFLIVCEILSLYSDTDLDLLWLIKSTLDLNLMNYSTIYDIFEQSYSRDLIFLS